MIPHHTDPPRLCRLATFHFVRWFVRYLHVHVRVRVPVCVRVFFMVQCCSVFLSTCLLGCLDALMVLSTCLGGTLNGRWLLVCVFA
mmetsp:Transcript_34889/g.86601  ORF Transcript_34889/g.86601 Transcript_34889/m.86601 type:complete len:86 (+) Transcript_34889:557-814(+)